MEQAAGIYNMLEQTRGFDRQTISKGTKEISMLFKTSSIGTFNSISQSDSTIYQTNQYGGLGGGSFTCSFGSYISKLITYTQNNSTPILRGIKFIFDNKDEVLIGTVDTSCSDVEIDLSSDSISKMYVLIVNNEVFQDPNKQGCGAIYIETIKGHKFTSFSDCTPLNYNGNGQWQLVSSQLNEPLVNFFLVGASGRSGNSIDQLFFYFQNDFLISRVVENFDYSQLTPSSIPTPINVASQIVDNATSETQEASISFTESVSSAFTWSAEAGITVGAETTLKTGIPFVAEGQVTLSLEISFAYTWGEEKTVTREFNYQANVSVPSNSNIIASATAASYQLSGSYAADFTENWVHAGAKTNKITGKIDGLSAYNVEVKYKTQTSQSGTPHKFTIISELAPEQ